MEVEQKVPLAAPSTQVPHKEACDGFSPWPWRPGIKALLERTTAYSWILIEVAGRGTSHQRLKTNPYVDSRQVLFLFCDVLFTFQSAVKHIASF